MNKRVWIHLRGGRAVSVVLLAVLLLQAAAEFGVIQPAQQALELARAQRLRRELRLATMDTQPSPQAQALSQIEAHVQLLRSLPGPLERFEQLQSIAAQESVQLRNLSYAYARVSDQIERITLQMDAEAHYPRLRQFIRAVHAADAATGLVAVNINQASAESGPLKAQLQFAMYAAATQASAAVAKRP